LFFGAKTQSTISMAAIPTDRNMTTIPSICGTRAGAQMLIATAKDTTPIASNVPCHCAQV
jgi:hypothetical protein